MDKSFYFRLIFYVLITFILRGLFLLTAFLRGYGSASDHTIDEVILNIIFFTINIIAFFLFLKLIKSYTKREFLLIAILCLLFWLGLHLYYNYLSIV